MTICWPSTHRTTAQSAFSLNSWNALSFMEFMALWMISRSFQLLILSRFILRQEYSTTQKSDDTLCLGGIISVILCKLNRPQRFPNSSLVLYFYVRWTLFAQIIPLGGATPKNDRLTKTTSPCSLSTTGFLVPLLEIHWPVIQCTFLLNFKKGSSKFKWKFPKLFLKMMGESDNPTAPTTTHN